MLHEPASQSGHDPASAYKTRLGAWMFLLYSIIYVAFVVINLIWPGLMAAIGLGGMNLAVVYGFGLIAFALILAVIYNYLCLKEEKRLSVKGKEGVQ